MRYTFLKDDDSHWYLVPVNQVEHFVELCEAAYANDEYEAFENKFGDMRCNQPSCFTFEKPKEDQ